MPDTLPAAVPVAPAPSAASAPRRFYPWWLPGVALGAFAAGVTLVVVTVRAGREPTHRVEAVLQLPPGESEGARRSRVAFLRSPDLAARALAGPRVAALPAVRSGAAAPHTVAGRVAVAELAPDALAISLTGSDPEGDAVILEELLKRYIEDAVARERKERDEEVKRLERMVDMRRVEVDAVEKQAELLAHATGAAAGASNGLHLAALRQRLADAEAEVARAGREIIKAEAESAVLQRQLAAGAGVTPDPVAVEQAVSADPRVVRFKAALDEARDRLAKAQAVADGGKEPPAVTELRAEVEKAQKAYDAARKAAGADAADRATAAGRAKLQARLAQLATLAAVKKEERERLKEERDAAQKALGPAAGTGINLDAMREALAPQKAYLQKLHLRLAELRFAAQTTTPVAIRSQPSVEPPQTAEGRVRAVVIPTAVAFATGFALATAVSFVGLLFHVFRRFA